MAQCIVPLAELSSTSIDDVLRYSDARPNSSGKGKTVSVNFLRGGDPVRLVVQTPKMWCQFGLDEYQPDDGGPPKYSIRLGFRNMEGNPTMGDMHRLLSAIDQKNIDHAFANQAAWWPGKQPVSRDIIEDRYTSIVKKDGTGKGYEDQIRVKLNYRNNAYDGLVFDDSPVPQQVGTDYIEQRCHIIVLLEFGPLWIADKSFGHTVRAVQIKVFKQASIRALAITPDHDEVMEEQTNGGEPYEDY